MILGLSKMGDVPVSTRHDTGHDTEAVSNPPPKIPIRQGKEAGFFFFFLLERSCREGEGAAAGKKEKWIE